MIGKVGMNLPIEVVEQRGHGPLLFILAKFASVSGHAGLHRQHMFAQALRFNEFANRVPRLISIHRNQCKPRSQQTLRDRAAACYSGARSPPDSGLWRSWERASMAWKRS